MNGISRAVVGCVLGALCGVVLVGILGMLTGVRFIIEHADNLSYGLGSLPAGFFLFAFHIGIPVGAPIGAVLGAIIGVARRENQSLAQHPVDAPPGKPGLWMAAAFLVIAAILCVSVVVPIMMRRRELSAMRAQGDLVEQQVARLGGRPHYEPGLTRRIDLDGTNVTDDEMIALSRLEGFLFVDRLHLKDTKVTDRFVTTLKEGYFSLQVLDVSGTEVTDESLSHLGRIGLPLNWFSFARTNVSDAGLDHIKESFLGTDWFDLCGTRVTEEGVKRLMGRVRTIRAVGYGDPQAPKTHRR